MVRHFAWLDARHVVNSEPVQLGDPVVEVLFRYYDFLCFFELQAPPVIQEFTGMRPPLLLARFTIETFCVACPDQVKTEARYW